MLIRGLLVDTIQILQANIIRILWQTVRRITNEILEVKGLNRKPKIVEEFSSVRELFKFSTWTQSRK